MTMYELIIGFNYSKCKKGYIWCTDGTFIHPSKFKKSNKTAYGYALGDNTVVSLKRSDERYRWRSQMPSNPYYHRLHESESETDGVSNSEFLKSLSGYSFEFCPAIYECLSYSNAGVNSYMPASYELESLYWSIMLGKMRTDLITAGIYEMCNYRGKRKYGSYDVFSWSWVWSSSQYPSDTCCDEAKSVNYSGNIVGPSKVTSCHVIPFFKF